MAKVFKPSSAPHSVGPTLGPLPVGGGRASVCVAGLADLCVEGGILVVVVVVSGALGTAVSAAQGHVQGPDAGIGVLLISAQVDVQDLSVVPLPCLPLPQLPGLKLDPGGKETRNVSSWIQKENSG